MRQTFWKEAYEKCSQDTPGRGKRNGRRRSWAEVRWQERPQPAALGAGEQGVPWERQTEARRVEFCTPLTGYQMQLPLVGVCGLQKSGSFPPQAIPGEGLD